MSKHIVKAAWESCPLFGRSRPIDLRRTPEQFVPLTCLDTISPDAVAPTRIGTRSEV
jgi:hypothetical protein